MTSPVWRGQQSFFITGLVLGALTSGVLLGAVAGVVHLVPAPARVLVLAGLLTVLLGFELAGRPLSLPQNRRAVPQTIIPRANVDGPLQFGFEMGTGVRTYMPTALPHALVIAVLLVGGLGPGLLAGVGFGLGRALMPLARSRHPRTIEWDENLLRRLRPIGQLCAAGFAIAIVPLLLGEIGVGW